MEADTLDAADLHALARHLDGAPARAPEQARDAFNYQLMVETSGGTMELDFDESSVPDDLAPLLSRLSKQSRPMKP
jgi:hypothetical protein